MVRGRGEDHCNVSTQTIWLYWVLYGGKSPFLSNKISVLCNSKNKCPMWLMFSGYGSLQCHWFIHVPPGHKILLYFDDFEVEGNPAGRLTLWCLMQLCGYLRKHWWKQHKSWLCIVTVWTQMHNLYMEITIVVPMHFYIICWPPRPSSGAAQLLWWRSLESSSLIKSIREIRKREFQMKSSNLSHFHNSNAGGF